VIDHSVRYHSKRLEWTRLVMVSVISFMMGAAAQRTRDVDLLAQCVSALDSAHAVVSELPQWIEKRRCK
jgi:hypothetical protein